MTTGALWELIMVYRLVCSEISAQLSSEDRWARIVFQLGKHHCEQPGPGEGGECPMLTVFTQDIFL